MLATPYNIQLAIKHKNIKMLKECQPQFELQEGATQKSIGV